MYDVTESNFEEIFPKICDLLKKTKFISIDAEFSGIKTSEEAKVSLFDTGEQRYDIQRKSIHGCIIIQFGLTTYDYDREANKYTAHVFNFYLFPRVVPGRDKLFEWQASSIEFLCSHGFDFNKFAHEGISYITDEEECQLRQNLANDTLLQYTERAISYKDEDNLRAIYGKVSDWLKNDTHSSSMIVDAPTPILRYLVQKELRNRFPSIWTEAKSEKVIVQRVENDVRKILAEKDKQKLERDLVNSCTGFSKLFKLLVELKKPIIGHNIMLDLLFIHQQFHKALPNKYCDFKRNIHELFPLVYDTKHLSFQMKRILGKKASWKSNGLSDLYAYFTEGSGKHHAMNAPKIEMAEKPIIGTEHFHQAGWDSYCAGVCFTKIAHMFAVARYGGSTELRPLTNTEILAGPSEHVNHVNLIRASIDHVNLGGPDPRCKRPKLLHVQSLGVGQLNITHIADMFSTYGVVDVKPLYTRRQALVAVANHIRYLKINITITRRVSQELFKCCENPDGIRWLASLAKNRALLSRRRWSSKLLKMSFDKNCTIRYQACDDLQPHSSCGARDILTRFQTSRDILVTPYSMLRHSLAVKVLLWSGILILGTAALIVPRRL